MTTNRGSWSPHTSHDRAPEHTADELLAGLEIGDPRPHPVDPAEWGTSP